MLRRSRLPLCGFLIALLSACSDAGGPAIPASIAQQSSANLSGTVGQPIATRPSVRILDASDAPAAGVTVSWAVISGDGSIGSSTSVTNSDGVATVSSWTLGTTAGENRLRATTASLDAVDFVAIGIASAANLVVIHAGNNQTVLTGQVVPVDPAVKVVDQYGNGKPNVQVVFNLVSGGGVLTDAIQVTGVDGVAALGAWKVGVNTGINSISATAAALPAVQFNATANLSPGCQQTLVYNIFSTVPGALADDDCLIVDDGGNAFYHDFLSVNVSAPQAMRFSLMAPVFSPYLLLVGPDGSVIAEGGDGPEFGSAASLSIIASSGLIVAAASSAAAQETGLYFLTSESDDGQANGCELIFAMRGITTVQNLTAGDCVNDAGPYYSDQFAIKLQAGFPVTINLSSPAFDTWLELYGMGSDPVAVSDNISALNLNSRIVYTPSVTGYYFISASSFLPEDTGEYTLSISADAASFPAASAPGVPLMRRGVVPRR